jgi:hypothetical protein
MALNVANWSDKQLDELTDLLRSADFSSVASFISQNFLCAGSRIMDDDTQTTLRVTVGTNVTTVSLSAGVFQHSGKVAQLDTAQIINILDPTGPGNWGPGMAAYPAADRWTIISIKQADQYNTLEQRWFVDDTVTPNLYSQRSTLTLINKAYYDIIVTHGSAGVATPPTTPSGYFTICEIFIPAACTDLSAATIYDTTDNPPFYTSTNWSDTTRVQRLEFWSTLFSIDHDPATGFHRSGAWHIGATTVTSSANELNRLTGVGGTVTAGNLTSLTNGSNIGATLHNHGTGGQGYILLTEEYAAGNDGPAIAVGYNARLLNTKPIDDVSIAVPAAGQFILPAGTYWFYGGASLHNPSIQRTHRTRLYNITTATQVAVGGSVNPTAASSAWAYVVGKFTIAVPTTFEFQQWASGASPESGHAAGGDGINNEIWAFIELTKVA